jgi:hypothetical protein
MTQQRDLFDYGVSEPLAAPKPAGELPGPPTREQVNGDCQRILERLQESPATNVELQAMVMGYRQRISDLRRRGYRITNKSLEKRVSVYSLVTD